MIGASDKNGAYPATDPIRGGDLTATIFHLLGIDPHGMFIDKSNRPHPITKGEPIAAMLGTGCATSERCTPGGDPAFVPPFDSRLLLDTDFKSGVLVPPSPLSRDKGWRAFPPWTKDAAGLAVRHAASDVEMGYGLQGEKMIAIEAGAKALLAQEIRNARGGHYTFTVNATAEASSAEEFEKSFLPNLTVRLMIVRYRDMNKDPRNVDELAAGEFRPAFGKTMTFKVDRFLGSATPGANFPIGNGLGVVIVVEKKSPGVLALANVRAALRIHSVSLEFSAAKRYDNNID